MKLDEKTLPKELRLDKNFEQICNLCIWSVFSILIFVGTITTCDSPLASSIFLIVPCITIYLLFFDKEQKSLRLLSKGIKKYNNGNIKEGIELIEQARFLSPKSGYDLKIWMERFI